MKDVLMFVLPGCPHCKLALKFQEELMDANPAWRDIPIRIVDESREAAFADAHDYYYVPTWYVDGEKVFEGGKGRCGKGTAAGRGRSMKKWSRPCGSIFILTYIEY